MAHLNALPVEVLMLIVRFCSKKDASNLRTLGSKHAEAAAPALFEHFHLCCFEFSLERLRAIASPSHGKYVRRITFHTKVLSDNEFTTEEFEERLSEALEDTGGDMVASFLPPRSQWPELWLKYLVCRSQCSMFFKDASHQSLRDAIAALPALEELSIIRAGLYYDMLPWKPTKLSPGPVLLLCNIIDPRAPDKDEHCTEWMLGAIARRALEASYVKVTKLSAIASIGRPSDVKQSEIPQRQDILGALEHIEFLHLTHISERTSHLEHMTTLVSCQQVQDLTIHCSNSIPNSGDIADGITPISKTMSSMPMPWPHLATLSITRVHLLNNEFNSFLSSHANTLVSLRIAQSWSDDFRKVMRHVANMLRLQEIHMTELYDPSCYNEPELSRDKTYFQDGIADDAAMTAWLLGSQEEEPDLQPRMYEDPYAASGLSDYDEEEEEIDGDDSDDVDDDDDADRH